MVVEGVAVGVEREGGCHRRTVGGALEAVVVGLGAQALRRVYLRVDGAEGERLALECAGALDDEWLGSSDGCCGFEYRGERLVLSRIASQVEAALVYAHPLTLATDVGGGEGQRQRLPVVLALCFGSQGAAIAHAARRERHGRHKGIAVGERDAVGVGAAHHVLARQCRGHRGCGVYEIQRIGVGRWGDGVDARHTTHIYRHGTASVYGGGRNLCRGGAVGMVEDDAGMLLARVDGVGVVVVERRFGSLIEESQRILVARLQPVEAAH